MSLRNTFLSLWTIEFLCTDSRISKKIDNVQLTFFVLKQTCGYSWEYFTFFKECAAASKKILTTASENYQKKKCATAFERKCAAAS